MRKISIVCERDEVSNTYGIKTIVIFEENKAPRTITYESVQDLLSVVKFAEENGFDILDNGIKSCLDSGLIEIISKSNEKRMSELKAEIVQEELKYPNTLETEIVNEAKEEEKELVKEMEPTSPVFKRSELGDIKEEGKITRETSMFRKTDLPEEYSDFAEYLKLSILKRKNTVTEEQLARIEELEKTNEFANGLATAERLLKEKKLSEKEYMNIYDIYRSQLATAIKQSSIVTPDSALYDYKENTETPQVPEEYRREVINPTNSSVEPVVSENTETPQVPEEFRREVINPTNSVVEPVVSENTETPQVPEEFRREYVGTTPEVDPNDISQSVDRTRIINEIKKLNPGATIVSGDPMNEFIYSSIPGDKLVLPNGFYYNDKNGITNKHNTKTGVYTTIDVEPLEKTMENQTEEPTKKGNAILVRDDKEKEAKGINENPDEEYDIEYVDDNGDTQVVKARTSSKFKQFLKDFGAVVLGLATFFGALFGINKLIEKHANKKAPVKTPNPAPIVTEAPEVITLEMAPTPTPKPAPTVPPTMKDANVQQVSNSQINVILNNFYQEYQVPEATRAFLERADVAKFLSQYKNPEQLKEVVSALAFGYEANILTTKEGNFRLDVDGENYLTMFTKDFLSAKIVVNRYDATQMTAILGNSNISVEEIMNNFKNYCYTVTTYGMNSTEPLPFRYLTDDPKALKVLNELSELLINVNEKRANGTLTTKDTDAFIVKVFETYVLNDESLGLSQGAKNVGGALVDSFCLMQSLVWDGDALYLHEDNGYATKGLNLKDVDGHFVLNYPDKTRYEFTNLYDVMNHGYGDVNETAARCLSEQEELLANLNTMKVLLRSNSDSAKLALANALYQEGRIDEGNEVSAGSLDEGLLDRILIANPTLNELVENYRLASENSGKEYINFEETVQGVDKLLGIEGRLENNYADLINNRRDALRPELKFGRRVVVDKKVTHRHEEVSRDEAVSEFGEEAVEKAEEAARAKVDEERAQQEEKIEEAKEELMEGVQEGKTQEELEEIASEAGITLDPHYQENMEAALAEQAAGEEKAHEIEESVASHNQEAEAQAAAREQAEAQKQQEESSMLDSLIAQSAEADAKEAAVSAPKEAPKTETPAVDQTDSGRKESDEIPYTPESSDTSSVAEELEALKAAALQLDVDNPVQLAGTDGGRSKTL